MEKHIILGVHITERMKNARLVQDLLSEYGCNIKTRIGLHQVHDTFCSPNGLMILEMSGDEAICLELEDKLRTMIGVAVQKMVFDHP